MLLLWARCQNRSWLKFELIICFSCTTDRSRRAPDRRFVVPSLACRPHFISLNWGGTIKKKSLSFRSGILVIWSVDQTNNSPGYSAHMLWPSEVLSDPNTKIFERVSPSKISSTNLYWSWRDKGLLLPGNYGNHTFAFCNHTFAFCCIEM